MRRIILTVTNDLTYDQRMQKIAGSLADAGYEVLLVGRQQKKSCDLTKEKYRQSRLPCFFNKGFHFYFEFNIRLFFFLLFKKASILCAIDLDTIIPVYLCSFLKNQQRVYDAHEIFTEQKEVLSRPWVHRIWLAIEKFAVPRFPKGYTVNQSIVKELQSRYGVNYALVRNLPMLLKEEMPTPKTEKWFLYQGAVNEGRCFESLIPAMKQVNARLIIVGRGNFYEQTKALIQKHQVEDKVLLKGNMSPDALKSFTPQAYCGITLFESEGMNQYYSLANRFFDYMMAGIPQICVNYPEYAAIVQENPFALMVDDTSPETIAAAMNNLLADTVLNESLTKHCLSARSYWNWELDRKTLVNFYVNL